MAWMFFCFFVVFFRKGSGYAYGYDDASPTVPGYAYDDRQIPVEISLSDLNKHKSNHYPIPKAKSNPNLK